MIGMKEEEYSKIGIVLLQKEFKEIDVSLLREADSNVKKQKMVT